ncbi:unnamed protein product [Cylicocyclus nassatus]|uniref:Uncharacterized protein n=1 Tax=Cylicocyclus nassatus TaxID=53992 RepID=A0AA36DLP4_CYLNA|nr:unnamed protein product [Cylicocyclus nassatus]
MHLKTLHKIRQLNQNGIKLLLITRLGVLSRNGVSSAHIHYSNDSTSQHCMNTKQDQDKANNRDRKKPFKNSFL